MVRILLVSVMLMVTFAFRIIIAYQPFPLPYVNERIFKPVDFAFWMGYSPYFHFNDVAIRLNILSVKYLLRIHIRYVIPNKPRESTYALKIASCGVLTEINANNDPENSAEYNR